MADLACLVVDSASVLAKASFVLVCVLVLVVLANLVANIAFYFLAKVSFVLANLVADVTFSFLVVVDIWCLCTLILFYLDEGSGLWQKSLHHCTLHHATCLWPCC